MAKKNSWRTTDSGLLVLRIGVGVIFIITGILKIANLSETIGMFAAMGFGAFWVYLVSAIEFVGGICVALGVHTRTFATILAIVMIAATYTMRTDPTEIMTPIIMFFATAALALASGGKHSIMKK